jgi:hypothetical protein
MRDCLHRLDKAQNAWFWATHTGDGTVNSRFFTGTLALGLLTGIIYFAAGALLNPKQASEASGNDEIVDQQLQAIIPISEQLVEEAIAALSKGWMEMNQSEQEAFLALYDPANTGEVDQEFVESTLVNYRRIQETLGREIAVVYEPDSEQCEGKRLYYTDLFKLHVCPYFFTEGNEIRKARTLIHEMAHIALLVRDRTYYRPTNKAYAQLTPRGSWLAQLPVVGPAIREIQQSDTLYHPDAYAHFTVALSGQPLATGMIGDQHYPVEAAGPTAHPTAATELQLADSWSLGS